ncbi:hypothetical protein BGZ70_010189 [Mortierella alpina]|uniref:Uncharacterized protein n=1 Tax=Mortierella alpina TaxID=64518 RepID=A0A9P6IZN9_MORAP|nr:hypothetical protein BGZ70_010189 [Mortierella alpina]
MATQLAPSKRRKFLMGYRRSLIALAMIMLALDCATIGLFASLMNSGYDYPGYDYLHGIAIDKADYILLLTADLLTIVFFALLIFRPQGFALFNKLSSRVLRSCRVFYSLGLTVLVLYEPAVELDMLMVFKDELSHMRFRGAPDVAHEVYMDYVFCGGKYTPASALARTNQQYCQVARSRWFLGFLLSALVLIELALSFWARDSNVQWEQDGTLEARTEEYKAMIESEA